MIVMESALKNTDRYVTLIHYQYDPNKAKHKQIKKVCISLTAICDKGSHKYLLFKFEIWETHYAASEYPMYSSDI